MSPRVLRSHFMVAATTLAALVAGCGTDDPSIDADALQEAVADAVAATGTGDVVCPTPEGIEPQTLTCTADLAGSTVEIVVVATVDPAITPPVALADVTIDALLLDVRAVEVEAAARIRTDLGGSPIVRCPHPMVVIAAGSEMDCEVSDVDRGVIESLTVRLVDSEGTWEIDLFG